MPTGTNPREKETMMIYTKGDRIEFISSSDSYTRLQPGTLGTVSMVDSMGTVHVRWDDGSTLGMIPGEDQFRLIT